jgi:hypothetical protein
MLRKLLKFLKVGNNTSPKIENIQNTFESNLPIEDILEHNFNKKENLEQLDAWLVYNYFNEKDNNTEKKYKILALSLALDSKTINLFSLPNTDGIVKKTTVELIDAEETKTSLYTLFRDPPLVEDYYNNQYGANPYRPVKRVKGSMLAINFLEEDKGNEEKLLISKDSYKKFAFLGLLSRSLFYSNPNVNSLLELQDFKFSDYDYKRIKTNVSKIKENPKSVDNMFPVDFSFEPWDRIINNENNLDNLKLINEFLVFQEELNPKSLGNRDFDEIIRNMNSKIQYMELEQNLDTKLPLTTKRHKI